jgi:hypothetical protein
VADAEVLGQSLAAMPHARRHHPACSAAFVDTCFELWQGVLRATLLTQRQDTLRLFHHRVGDIQQLINTQACSRLHVTHAIRHIRHPKPSGTRRKFDIVSPRTCLWITGCAISYCEDSERGALTPLLDAFLAGALLQGWHAS